MTVNLSQPIMFTNTHLGRSNTTHQSMKEECPTSLCLFTRFQDKQILLQNRRFSIFLLISKAKIKSIIYHPISEVACKSRKTQAIYTENIYYYNQEDVATKNTYKEIQWHDAFR
jgi:hypothetical protein